MRLDEENRGPAKDKKETKPGPAKNKRQRKEGDANWPTKQELNRLGEVFKKLQWALCER